MSSDERRGRRRPGPTLLAGSAIVVLAAFAALWPRDATAPPGGRFLVLDPTGGARERQVYQPLARHCAAALGRELTVEVVDRPAEFLERAPGALVLLCPDGVALRLKDGLVAPLAAGQRRAPQNLRPTPVVVSRAGAPGGETPWFAAPERTVFGDSLSLVCLAPLCAAGRPVRIPPGAAVGSDPYDHRAVLEALRLGAFDHAVVRQWAGDTFLASPAGRLGAWSVRTAGEPVPDVVLLAGRGLSGQERLTLAQAVVTLGRHVESAPPRHAAAQAALAGLGLDGFGILLDPDFAALRERYRDCWPSARD